MIIIKSIEFNNFRQYKKILIDFNSESINHLYVLRAKNGTGKTTFLNGILWCLYEKEYYINDENKALPIVNSSLVQASNEDEKLKVSVVVTIDDGASTIRFERTQDYKVIINPIKGNKTAVGSQSNLKIVCTPNEAFENSKVFEDDLETKNLVKQYFDETIYDYYFFDGENLKNYFAKGKSNRIKDSIHNISQVTLLTNAITHMNSIHVEKARTLARLKDNDVSVYEDIEKLESKIKKLEKEITELELELPTYKQQYNEADSILTGYAPIRQNTIQRIKLSNELDSLNKDFDSFKVKKQIFLRESLVYLSFYPRVKKTLELIKDKQASGTLPPSIDKDQIKGIIEKHIEKCPVCDSKIDENSLKHLQELLTKLDVSSATSNYLMEIKGSLETVIDKCIKFPSVLKEINKTEKYYLDEISGKEKEITDINKFLATYADEKTEEVNVSNIEKTRSQNLTAINQCEKRIELNKNDIKYATNDLNLKYKEREQFESKNDFKNILANQVKIFRILESNYNLVKTSIMNDIKNDIQKLTWQMFDSMIWKKNTFGRISIDNSYALSVYDTNDNEMTGGLGATEYMALAYSFTLAIHEASGKNCPLVVDSPLGRVSDENRVNMANELLKVSKKKQIIMLFTPDEYSEEVKNIYDTNAASIRDIVLAEDEKEIKKVGD